MRRLEVLTGNLFDRQSTWLVRILPVSGNTPLRHNIYLKSSLGRRRHNGWQCVLLCALRLTLLLNIIRQANMTDDEEDSAAKSPPEKGVFKKIPISFLAHSTKPIPAAVLSCQLEVWRHRLAPKCGAGCGRDGEGWTDCGWVYAHGAVPIMPCWEMETWTFYNKSLIIFYGALQLILFPHVSGIYITVASSLKLLCSLLSWQRSCCLSTPLCLLHKYKIYRY